MAVSGMMLEPVRFLFNESINVFLQSSGNSFFDLLFLAISAVFSQPGLMLFSSSIFWCHDRKNGILLMYITLFSALASIVAKSFFAMPRPPEYFHKTTENGFGFPSGHVMVSSSFFGYLGWNRKNRVVSIIGATAIIAVSISRIYLGVHYVGDVIGGLFFGSLIAFIIYKAHPGILKVWETLDARSKYFFILISPVIIPAIAALQGGILREHIELALVMTGTGIGYILEEELIKFEDVKNNTVRIRRLSISILILAIVYLFGSLLFHDHSIFTYGILGFASTFIAPWAFTRME